MSTTPKPHSSEDIVGQKVRICGRFSSTSSENLGIFHNGRLIFGLGGRAVADFLVKAGVGFSAGVVLSVVLFRRRTWPISLATGFGAGAAYADCDRSFNPARIPGTRIISQLPPTTPASK
ncbi:MICOS complex subunit MIC10 [Mycena chlorophos]|uniref:MICOS complex subunit MIC10 n=1 Tax=Mycena chlorophos TaxID=658473 RepID=A0A8H6TSA9_MYCCL|nr:MICOS complex subunit MIC10 [Mycena chlorophos]